MKLCYLLGIAGIAALTSVGAVAQVPVVPQVTQVNPGDLFQDVVNGAPMAPNKYAAAPLLGSYGFTLDGGNVDNILVAGDFTQNLFQRGTSITGINGTYTYTADRWFVWGGSSSSITASQTTDVPVGYGDALRINRTSSSTTQVCVAQTVETINSLRLQGQTAEFDFLAKAGSTFSSATSALQVYVLTGTGTDDGAQKAAYSINAGGGGSSAYAGAVLFGGTGGYTIPITTSYNRYSVAVPVATTATEVTVAICYTPTSSGSSTDWFEFTGAQLLSNPSLTPIVGTTGVALNANDARAKSFSRLPLLFEQSLQLRYYQSIAEPALGVGIGTTGVLTSTTSCALSLPLSVAMRVAPTISFTGTALSTSTWRIQDSTTSTLASTFLVAGAGQTVFVLNLTATLTTASTAGWGCQLQGAAGGSIINANAEL
jgi:hypothetical protein